MSVSRQRVKEVADLQDWASNWARRRSDVAGLLLVGSWARAAAREDSDVDLVLLSDDPALYNTDSLSLLGTFVTTRTWGPTTEWRWRTISGLEIELSVATPDWAATSPLDAGTRRVITDGARSLYDPRDLVADLMTACAAPE
ncbi:hypothetical protein LP52_15270 [Streptomonospora alba]|uniref:Polymerase nucleotidyl transferase domain-containing protein n=1 Tax=Streptomonospora alba TaxID=183763 RepID=A0A0C2G478_9ACTN|nr:nucleotidyltransferase domain-containing protein [Streptomonospora alba]KIH98063.1 hypothetical protein LP52_15270 [Streptomonospora alba]